MQFRTIAPVLFFLAFIATIGACHYGPTTVKQPSINASQAGQLAMEMYDKNGDGKVAGDELEAAPALKAALPRLDINADGGVSADEVAARVNAWKAMQTALTGGRCHVTLDGQPLADAQVVFEPESFLGENIKIAAGKTNVNGDASPSVAPKDLPDAKLPSGVHFGLYKVRITKTIAGKETIPARYNTDTVLGQEVSYDDPGCKNHNIVYALKSG